MGRPKKNAAKAIKPQEKTEDDIIADAIVTVGEGILTNNWKLVCEGYNVITGEDLQPPEEKPKSRLEKIRDKIGKSSKPSKTLPKSKKSKLGGTTEDLEDEDGSTVKVTKEKVGDMQIISDPYNEEEAKKNSTFKRTKLQVPLRDNMPKDTSNTDADVRFHNTNRRPG